MKLKRNKVLCRIGKGKTDTILGCLLKTINNSTVDETIVVTGFQHEQVAQHIEKDILPSFQNDKPLIITHNVDHKLGMAVSFSRGASSLDPQTDAFLLFLGDQPLIKVETICAIIAQYEKIQSVGEDFLLLHPRVNGKKGHPVVFSSRLREEVLALGEKNQPRDITWKYRKRAHIYDIDDRGIGMDIDTTQDLKSVRANFSGQFVT